MSDVAIRVEGLGKQYRVGRQVEKYRTLRESLKNTAVSPFRIVRDAFRQPDEDDPTTIWALRDVHFEIQQGEVVGVIGRNGAGKSTLLKVLSRITQPSRGHAEVHGRVGSLLEVGTGFHLELTGRENVYLNGAILGMTRREVDLRFDEIVEFAGVERFIDTPVKRYSTGMRLRLGFSVAAHLDPEILIIDEVLAVGDASFQRKCLGKMGDISRSGRTVLFVSHNMNAVTRLCDRALVLDSGRITADDSTQSAISAYLRGGGWTSKQGRIDLTKSARRIGTGTALLTSIAVRSDGDRLGFAVGIGERFDILLECLFLAEVNQPVVGVEIKTLDEIPLANLRSDSSSVVFEPQVEGDKASFEISVPGLPFYPGTYVLHPWISETRGRRADHVTEPIELTLLSQGQYDSERNLQPGRGIVLIDCAWRKA